jgi:peptide/nickel transport system permease protein
MFVLTVWIGATVIFIIPRLAPGDPVAAMVARLSAQSGYVENSAALIESWRKMFGLDDPLLIQYVKYLGNVLTFNLGYSLSQFPILVQDMVSQSMPWTVALLSVATIISFILGNAVGALMGWRRTPSMIRNLLPVTLTFTAIPFFMLAILLIYVFGFGLHLFPVTGGYNSDIPIAFNWKFISDAAYHAILPAFSIVIASMGFWALGMRGMMITTAGEDYLILAQAKGLRPPRVFWRYAVRNAVLPQVTALALTFGAIVGGSTLVEYLFAYPGMGYLLYQGIVNQDYTVIQGICFILIFATALAVLIIDLLYPLIDPRITYQKK